jgi:hypothetical protein
VSQSVNTDRELYALKPEATRYERAVTKARGLSVLAYPNGCKVEHGNEIAHMSRQDLSQCGVKFSQGSSEALQRMQEEALNAGRVLVATVLYVPGRVDVNFAEDLPAQLGAILDSLGGATFYWYSDADILEALKKYVVHASLTEKTKVVPIVE